jgi:S-adenosylmethionine decarboxylase
MIIGTLYTVDFEGVEEEALLNDPKRLAGRLREVVETSGLQIVGEPLIHQFCPQGITYLVVLAKSHLAAHTWPEHRFLMVDFFTCGDPELGQRAYEVLQCAIPCRRVIGRVIERDGVA